MGVRGTTKRCLDCKDWKKGKRKSDRGQCLSEQFHEMVCGQFEGSAAIDDPEKFWCRFFVKKKNAGCNHKWDKGRVGGPYIMYTCTKPKCKEVSWGWR